MGTGTRQRPRRGSGRRGAILLLGLGLLAALVSFAVFMSAGSNPAPDGRSAAPPATDPAPRGEAPWLGFETPDLSEWTAVQEAAPDRISVVRSPVRSGRYAARFEHRQGDLIDGGARSEVYLRGKGGVSSGRFSEGDDVWFGWSTRFDESFPFSERWGTFVQWKQEGGGSPPLQMGVKNDQLRVIGGPDTGWYESAHVDIERGAWHDFVVHVRFSSDEDSGFVEAWHNGERMLDKEDLPTLESDKTSYLKQGLYRDKDEGAPAVVFHDSMTIGDSYKQVAPGR